MPKAKSQGRPQLTPADSKPNVGDLIDRLLICTYLAAITRGQLWVLVLRGVMLEAVAFEFFELVVGGIQGALHTNCRGAVLVM